jgi:hypothetical protein
MSYNIIYIFKKYNTSYLSSGQWRNPPNLLKRRICSSGGRLAGEIKPGTHTTGQPSWRHGNTQQSLVHCQQAEVGRRVAMETNSGAGQHSSKAQARHSAPFSAGLRIIVYPPKKIVVYPPKKIMVYPPKKIVVYRPKNPD